MSVSLAGDGTRAAAARSTTDWWLREVELVERLRVAGEQTQAILGAELSLPAVKWDAPWRAAEMVSTLTRACLEELRETPSAAVDRAQQLCDLILKLQQLAMDWYLHDTAMRGQRLADCAAGLSRLRTLPGSTALVDNVCEELAALRFPPGRAFQGREPQLEAADSSSPRRQGDSALVRRVDKSAGATHQDGSRSRDAVPP